MNTQRSGCPINLTVELLGDAWSLLIIRDLMFTDRRHFRDLLRMDEQISSSVLSDRLDRLVAAGLLDRTHDPAHSQKVIYTLTESGIDLLPVIAQLASWGRRHRTADEVLSARSAALDQGGNAALAALRAELRRQHLPRG